MARNIKRDVALNLVSSRLGIEYLVDFVTGTSTVLALKWRYSLSASSTA